MSSSRSCTNTFLRILQALIISDILYRTSEYRVLNSHMVNQLLIKGRMISIFDATQNSLAGQLYLWVYVRKCIYEITALVYEVKIGTCIKDYVVLCSTRFN